MGVQLQVSLVTGLHVSENAHAPHILCDCPIASPESRIYRHRHNIVLDCS
jgi:hypothetical protein